MDAEIQAATANLVAARDGRQARLPSHGDAGRRRLSRLRQKGEPASGSAERVTVDDDRDIEELVAGIEPSSCRVQAPRKGRKKK